MLVAALLTRMSILPNSLFVRSTSRLMSSGAPDVAHARERSARSRRISAATCIERVLLAAADHDGGAFPRERLARSLCRCRGWHRLRLPLCPERRLIDSAAPWCTACWLRGLRVRAGPPVLSAVGGSARTRLAFVHQRQKAAELPGGRGAVRVPELRIAGYGIDARSASR